jgi:hypothetical protein
MRFGRSPLVWAALFALGTGSGCVRQAPSTVPSDGFCSPGYQAQFGWPDPEKAAQVCHCESSGNPRATSPNGKYAGLFQFSEATWNELGGGPVFDPAHNSAQAYRLFQRRGWKPWPHCGG